MIDNYKDRLLEYAKGLSTEYLKKKGKYIADTKKVYVIYVRKSTKGKDRQERSIPDQIKDCQITAKTQGITPQRIFREEESAKTSGKRDVFTQMIQGIRNGTFNSIIAWHPDRLARNMKDAGEIIDLLDRGVIVDLKFCQYTFVNDANGVMTLGIQFVLAKQYSDNLSAVSQRGSINIAKEGRSPTNKPKYGYILNSTRHFKPDGKNFTLLQQGFRMALDNKSLDEVADYLNKNSFHYGGKVTAMSKQKMSDIFRDPFCAGLYVYGSEVIDMKTEDPTFKPLVSPLDFLELRRILGTSTSFKRTQEIKTFLFSKMVHCGYCGHLMTPGKPRSGGKSRQRYLSLRCNNKNCSCRLDKIIKKGVRGKVIFEYITSLLGKGLEVDKTAYEAYKVEAFKSLTTKEADYRQMIISLARHISETKEIKEKKTNALANAQSDSLIKELNNQISSLDNEMKSLELRKKEAEELVTSVDHSLTTELMSYENFLNFFKNIGLTVRNSDNAYLVDKIIRMVFLNFVVKNQIVTSHQLNPFFGQYGKMPSVLPSRRAET